MSPLRILHVIPSMAPEVGGPPVVCAGIAGALAIRGHSLAIATVNDPNAPLVPVSPAVNLFAFPPDSPSGYRPSQALTQWLTSNTQNFDLLHLHSLWQFPTFAAAKAAWHAKRPYVVLLNGMLDHYSVHHRSYWKKRLYWLLRESRIHTRAAAIHCLNHAEIRRAVPWIADLPKFVVGNAIASSELAALPPRGRFRAAHPNLFPSPETPIALFLSRIHPKKGLDRLLPAWKSFIQQLPTARLIIAGTGDADYLTAIDRLITSFNLSNHVFRVGQLVGQQKWEALVDADIFVLPSHQEGFSMAITEALAAGLPPVVTEECNFDELDSPTEPRCGIIIKNGDMEAFTTTAAALLNNPAQRAAFAAAGQSLVARRFTWEKTAEQLEAIYHQILSGKPLPTT